MGLVARSVCSPLKSTLPLVRTKASPYDPALMTLTTTHQPSNFRIGDQIRYRLTLTSLQDKTSHCTVPSAHPLYTSPKYSRIFTKFISTTQGENNLWAILAPLGPTPYFSYSKCLCLYPFYDYNTHNIYCIKKYFPSKQWAIVSTVSNVKCTHLKKNLHYKMIICPLNEG